MPATRPIRPATVAALTVPRMEDERLQRAVQPIVDAIRDLQRRISLLENAPDGEDVTVVASPLWDTILVPGQITTSIDNWVPGAFGQNTLVRVTTDATRNVSGMVGGVDGIVVALLNVNATGSNTPIYLHESGLSVAANRFHNAGGFNRNGQSSGCVWYRYDGISSRWQNIMDTQ